jgi:hypothetical protein
MAEELIMNVKSNVKQVTQDTTQYKKSLEQVNEEVSLQTSYIIAQEKELIKLKAQQDAIPKGAWVSGMDKLNDKIKATTAELNLEKNALKGLKAEQKGAAAAAKKLADVQKEQNQIIKTGVGNFQVMGVSLNSIRGLFGKIIPTAKLMFSTIKAGLISTGIGAFVVAIGTLIQYFTQTKTGAEMIQRAFAGVGAAISVITDRISLIGGAIVKVFKRDYAGALADVKSSAQGITEEIGKEYNEAQRLKGVLQDVADAERGLNLERAESNQIIAEARMIAEDENVSLDERIAALQAANAEELKVTAESLRIQGLKVLAMKEQAALNNSLAKDLDAINAEEVKLVNMQTASFKTSKKLERELNSLRRSNSRKRSSRTSNRRREEEKAEQARLNALEKEQQEIQNLIDIETERVNKLTVDAAALLDDFNNSQLDAIYQEENAIYDKYFAIIEGKRELGESVAELEEAQQAELAEIRNRYADEQDAKDKDRAKNLEDFKDDLKMKALGALGANLDASMSQLETNYAQEKRLAEANGQSTEAIDTKYEGKRQRLAQKQKAFKVAEALITTYQMASTAYKDGLEAGGPAGLILGPVAAAVAAAAGMANVRQILATDVGGGGGGGAPPGPDMSEAPAPQMMSGEFQLGGGVAPEAAKAFVVTDEMTNSQDQLANIRRTATI